MELLEELNSHKFDKFNTSLENQDKKVELLNRKARACFELALFQPTSPGANYKCKF